MLTHGSLFSGIGGFELAAQRAGIKTLWNCEIEEYPRLILSQHFPGIMQYTDIRTMSYPRYVDIISGGFPCQDISTANGHAKGIKGKKSGLWSEMARIIKETRPKYILIENSPMLLRRGFEKVLYDLSQIGYYAEWDCIRADWFGKKHRRERIYIVAYAAEMGRANPAMDFSQKVIKRGDTPGQWSQNPAIIEYGGYAEFIKKRGAQVSRMPQSQVCRMDDGIPYQLDSIQALGNAIVPDIAEYLFGQIIKFDNALKHPQAKLNPLEILRQKYSKAA
jgi:DNA (cytosine-5)-methyltransferase 1